MLMDENNIYVYILKLLFKQTYRCFNLHTMYGRQNINVFISRLNANLHACNTLLSIVSRTALDILQSQL